MKNSNNKTKLDFLSTTNKIIKEIQNINKNEDLLNYQFVNDTQNHSLILDYLSSKNSLETPYNVFENTQSPEFLNFLDDIFWKDFSIIFPKQKNQFIKHNEINNILLKVEKEYFFKNPVTQESNSISTYDYTFEDYSKFEFKITHNFNFNQFETSSSFKHIDIGHSDLKKMTLPEKTTHLNYINSFDFRKGKREINKKNLEEVINTFLQDINKLDLTTSALVDFHNRKHNGADILCHFIDKNYSLNDVESFLNYNNTDLYNIKKRNLYDPVEAYKNILLMELYNKLPCFLYNEKIHRLNMEIEYKDFIELFYHLEFKQDNIHLYKNNQKIHTWNNFFDNYTMCEDIANYIRRDFNHILKSEPQYEINFKNDFNYLLKTFFGNTDIKIESPDFYSLSIEEIINKELPFKISYLDDFIEKKINFACIENIQNETDLQIFKEKIKIKSSLDKEIFYSTTNKKRL